MNFTVTRGDPASAYILHVPHASTAIPAGVRGDLLLDDNQLAEELRHMTDVHTDRLALAAARTNVFPPWMFINRLSRMVVDPERFPDEREEMHRVGMGAVYTRTSHGHPLRHPDAAAEQRLLTRFFNPYAQGLTDLVAQRLAAVGKAVIVDLHSYPAEPLPYELHGDAHRPAVCLGVDPTHTPEWLLSRARAAFAAFETAVNEPFIGTYVPLRHYGRDIRVASIMVELRRDTYMHNNPPPESTKVGQSHPHVPCRPAAEAGAAPSRSPLGSANRPARTRSHPTCTSAGRHATPRL